MKNILLLIRTNVHRNKIAVVFAVLCAGVICLIMNLMSNVSSDDAIGRVKIGFIDNDLTELSADFAGYLSDTLHIELEKELSYDELSTKLINKEISVIVEVPSGFEEGAVSGSLRNLTTTSLDDYENSAFITVFMNTYMNSIKILSDSAGGDSRVFGQLLTEYKKYDIPISSSGVFTDAAAAGQESGFIQGMGFYLLFGFTYGLLIAFMVFDDRATGVFQRIRATPVKSVEYILGTTMFGIINGMITVGLFYVFLKITGYSIGMPVQTAILFMSLMTLLQIGFSMMAALFLKSKSAVMTVIIGYGTIACILGGAYFPIDMAPEVLQKIARLTPHFWFMDAMRRLQLNSSADIVPNVIILVLFIVLMYLVSAFKFTQKKSE